MDDNRDSILLYRGGTSVPTSPNIFHCSREKATLLKRGNVLGWVSSSDFHRNFIIAVKVEPSINSGENRILIFGGRGRNVDFSRTRLYKKEIS